MPADARLYREIRLEALQQAPEAFGSTFEQECSQSLAQFEEALTKADVFGAFRETDLLGMAGYFTQAGAKQAHKGLLWECTFAPSRVVPVSPNISSKRFSVMRANALNWFNWPSSAKTKQRNGSIAVADLSRTDMKSTL
jgi:hypothetical protein